MGVCCSTERKRKPNPSPIIENPSPIIENPNPIIENPRPRPKENPRPRPIEENPISRKNTKTSRKEKSKTITESSYVETDRKYLNTNDRGYSYENTYENNDNIKGKNINNPSIEKNPKIPVNQNVEVEAKKGLCCQNYCINKCLLDYPGGNCFGLFNCFNKN